jgi:hypothetical protein
MSSGGVRLRDIFPMIPGGGLARILAKPGVRAAPKPPGIAARMSS